MDTAEYDFVRCSALEQLLIWAVTKPTSTAILAQSSRNLQQLYRSFRYCSSLSGFSERGLMRTGQCGVGKAPLQAAAPL